MTSDDPPTVGERVVQSKTPLKAFTAALLTALLTGLSVFVTQKLDQLTARTDHLEDRQVQLTDDVGAAETKARDVAGQLVLTKAQREAEAARLRAQIAALESGADAATVQREALAAEARQARLDAAEAKAKASAPAPPVPRASAAPSKSANRPRPTAVASPKPAPAPSPSPKPAGLCALGLCETVHDQFVKVDNIRGGAAIV